MRNCGTPAIAQAVEEAIAVDFFVHDSWSLTRTIMTTNFPLGLSLQ